MRTRRDMIKFLSNLPGWRTRRKIILFESDDWGSNRMPSGDAYDALLQGGIPVDKNHFTRYDRVEGPDDLSGVLDVLSQFKDHQGRPPVFTTLNIMANPDFQRMKDSGYTSYYYESVNETYTRYGCRDSIKAIWQKGLEEGMLEPQFHGREHLNVGRWIKAMNAGLPVTRMAGEYGVTGLSAALVQEDRGDFQAALDFDDENELVGMSVILAEGLQMFKEYFGCSAVYFVPTNGLVSTKLYADLKRLGISAVGVSKLNTEPLGRGRYKKRFYRLGSVNKHGQTYITRNCLFEPSMPSSTDWVAKCLHDISLAFAAGKPAIISTHRVNYMGGIDSGNRDRGLLQLQSLLHQVSTRWADIEYLSTTGLLQEMTLNKAS